MELFINGKKVTTIKDIFKKEIKYIKCKHQITGAYFLNIQSMQYFLGRYDLWNSKNGDHLKIVTECGTYEYEFEKDRFWLIKDGVLINEIINKFLLEYEHAIEPHFEKGYVVAVIGDEIKTFKTVLYRDNSFDFDLVSSEKIAMDDVEEHETTTPSNIMDDVPPKDDGIIMTCERICHYNKDGVCIYFDEGVRLQGNLTHKHTCRNPLYEAEEI